MPADWRVVTLDPSGSAVVQDMRPAQGRPDGAPELSIEGLVFAGGFAVMSELDDDQAEWLAEMEAKMEAKGVGAHAETNGKTAPADEPEMTPAS